MHLTADSVSGQVANHTISVCFRNRLACIAYISQSVAGNGLTCLCKEALLRRFDQLLSLFTDLTNAYGQCTVGLPAIKYKTAVNG